MDTRHNMQIDVTEASGPAPRAQHAGGGGPETGSGRRLSAKRKLEAVQRLWRGESLDALSRELQVPAHRLSEWRERALVAAAGALKDRERDGRDDEIERLKAQIGEFTMANELLNAKIDRLEGGRPLAGRRPRT